MKPADRPVRLEDERQRLRQAAQRLLDGTPQRSNGKLTVVALATEAGLPRHRLYEHHAEFVSDFKTAAGGGPISPSVQALQQQLDEALQRIQQLEDENKTLNDRITTLCAVITELTHEAQADNIVALSAHSPRR